MANNKIIMLTQENIDRLSYKIIGCAIEVHKELGPGLLESIYEKCLIKELTLNGLKIKSQISVPIFYKGIEMNCDLRLDILVENLVIVEIKSVETIHPVFEAQLLTYMKLLQMPKGVLINFNCKNLFHDGQKTFVNEYYANLNKT
ncbi:MAG: GxxExxY protein [Bacteroidia bacterium]|nr:GxxExxY protein [Bacteroidia bacterium]